MNIKRQESVGGMIALLSALLLWCVVPLIPIKNRRHQTFQVRITLLCIIGIAGCIGLIVTAIILQSMLYLQLMALLYLAMGIIIAAIDWWIENRYTP